MNHMICSLNHCLFLLFFAGATNPFASRFLGFSVYVSNTTGENDGVLCFKDKSFTLDTIPNSINIKFPYHGRHVFFYENRTNAPLPAGYSDYAFNELCELEVFGTNFREKKP